MENLILALFMSAMLSLSGGLWSLSVALRKSQNNRVSILHDPSARDITESCGSAAEAGRRIPTSSRFTAINPSRFSSLADSSASKLCRREVSAPPRSQFLCEPIKQEVGSADTWTASLRSS